MSRYWPVIATETVTRVVWIEGETAEESAETANSWDGTIAHEEIQDELVIGGGITFDPEDAWIYAEFPEVGPGVRCTECGDIARHISDWLRHDGACSLHIHRPSMSIVNKAAIPGGRLGAVLGCSCHQGPLDLSGFWRSDRRDAAALPPGAVVVDVERIPELARAHVAGKRHAMNVPWGIDHDCRDEPCSKLAVPEVAS